MRKQPVVVFERMHHVDDPVFHALLSGGYEHYMLMGLPKEPQIYESVKRVVPRVHGVRLTEGGAMWLHAIVSITKQHDGDGKNAILAAFAGGHPSLKHVVVVDDDIDIYDDREVEWAIATRFQADRDLILIPNARGSSLDPPSADRSMTTKWGGWTRRSLWRERRSSRGRGFSPFSLPTIVPPQVIEKGDSKASGTILRTCETKKR